MLQTVICTRGSNRLRKCLETLFFDRQHFGQPAGVPLGRLVFCFQKCSDDLKRQFRPDDSATDAQHVHVVVLDALVCRVGVVTDRCPNTGNFVCRHADANTAATDHDPSIGVTADDLASNGDREIGVITAQIAVGATVDQGGEERTKTLRNRLFEGETGVVAAEGESNLDCVRHRILAGDWALGGEADLATNCIDTGRHGSWPRGIR